MRHSRKGKSSYDLFSSFAFYVPGIGGMFMLALMLVIGACFGNLLILLLTAVSDAHTAASYGMLISYPVMFIPAMLYASYQSRRNQLFEKGYALDSSHFGNIGGIWMALMAAVVTLAGNFLTDPVTSALPPMPESLRRILENTLLESPLWVSVISTVVFAPLFEEWLCRGMILRGLLHRVHPALAMVISAAFFAVIHANPWQAIPAFVLGMLFAYVYYRTGSLKTTMLMHMVNNGFALGISQIPAFSDIDASLSQFMDKWQYISLMAACMFIIVIFIDIVRKNIPLASGSGNCDETGAAGQTSL